MVNFNNYIKTEFLNMKIKDFTKIIHGKNKQEITQIIKDNKAAWMPNSLFDKYAAPEIESWFKAIDGVGIDISPYTGEFCYSTYTKPNNKLEKGEIYAFIRLNELWDNNKNLSEQHIDNMTIRDLLNDYKYEFED
jgi:hypothetical protein